MAVVVVDTNVILVANEAHPDVCQECIRVCVERLKALMSSGVVAVDDGYRIIQEYQNKTTPNRGKGVGDVFVKWVLTNSARVDRINQVTLTETEETVFEEFPGKGLEQKFDPPDRKFAAVAHAHSDKPPILQASDCKWLDWWPELLGAGVTVEFLCAEDLCRFYVGKFPDRKVPELP